MEKELITTNELADMLSVSRKFIEKHRNRIAGGVRIGRSWRFRVAEVRKRLAAGKDVIVK